MSIKGNYVADRALVAFAVLCVSGIVPMLAASALIAFVDTLPMWSQLPFCMALFLAAMWLFVRAGLTGGVR